MAKRWSAAIGLSALLLAGCRSRGPATLNLARVQLPERAAVLFLVDGLSAKTLHELAGQGKLPHIQQRFLDAGTQVDHAVGCIPSLTYPNWVSMFTGVFPGTHGIVANQWFDRRDPARQDYMRASTYLDVNQEFTVPTLYERLGANYTVNVQGLIRRGASATVDDQLAMAMGFFFNDSIGEDASVGRRLSSVAALARQQRRWPLVTTFYFPGVDQIGHASGSDSRQYAHALANVDQRIGRIISSLERSPLNGRLIYVLVSDHGHVPVNPEHVDDLLRWLSQERGLRIQTGHRGFVFTAERRGFFERYDAVAVNDGRRLAIYLRGKQGWSQAPQQRELDRLILGEENDPLRHLIRRPSVGFVCTRGPDASVHVRSPRGEVLIQRRIENGRLEFRVEPIAADMKVAPQTLEYMQPLALERFVESEWHPADQWLAQTANSPNPDFVPQVASMFDPPLAPDIVVFPRGDWSFTNAEASGHGSCAASDLAVVLMFAGPGISPGGHIPCARLVDLCPTLLDLLRQRPGRYPDVAMDGASLAEQLRGSATSQ